MSASDRVRITALSYAEIRMEEAENHMKRALEILTCHGTPASIKAGTVILTTLRKESNKIRASCYRLREAANKRS